MKQYLYVALAFLLLFSCPLGAAAQNRVDLQFIVSEDAKVLPTDKTEKDYQLAVRPNAGDADLFVYIVNPDNKKTSYYITASIDNRVVATSDGNLAGNGKALVHLVPVAGNPKPAEGKAANVAIAAAGQRWSAKSPLVLKAYYTKEHVDNANFAPAVLEIKSNIVTPDKYLQVDAEVQPNATSALGKLLFTVSVKPNVKLRSPCELQLDLSHITGLSPESLKEVNLNAKLDQDNEKAQLILNDIRLAGDTRQLEGFFAITADGCQRAFRFTTTASQNTTPQTPDGKNLVRVVIEKTVPGKPGAVTTRYIKPNKDVKVIARLEVDNADADTHLVYGLDRSGTTGRDGKKVYEKKRFDGTKNQSITVSLGKDDADGSTLRYAATMQDYEVPLNVVEGSTGEKNIMLQLMNTKTNTPVADDPYETSIIFDPNPPVINKFDCETEKPLRSGKVKVRASASSLSKIDKVYFYIGDPPATDAPTNKWVKGEDKKGNGLYEAELQLPDVKGPVMLGMRAINGVGEKMDEAREITVSEPPPPDPAAKLGKVRATVVQYADELPQPNLPVDLRNAKGEVVKSGKTDEKGEVLFEKIQPGSYSVRSVKAFDKSGGDAKVDVEAEKEATAKISLKRGR